MRIYKKFRISNKVTLYNGNCKELLDSMPAEVVDLIITSPPYCIGKAYEDPHNDLETFKNQHKEIFHDIYRVLKPGGSICWQVGYHISDAFVIPLDYIVYELFTSLSEREQYPLILRNRIIWTFGHGLNSSTRFSGRHETILWFTKGSQTIFNLNDIRVPQKYPGKRSYKGKRKGELSGNPLGKNPSDVWHEPLPEESTDVWDIPNVKANHVEKTEHPCQFPVAIPSRLIKALTNKESLVLDPFMGAGTTGVAAMLTDRRFVGAELQNNYYQVSYKRILEAANGTIKVRPDVPVMTPNPNTAVAQLPDQFAKIRKEKDETKEEKAYSRTKASTSKKTQRNNFQKKDKSQFC